jgi:hypothetical protein
MEIRFNIDLVFASGPFYTPWGNKVDTVEAKAKELESEFELELAKGPRDRDRFKKIFEKVKSTDYIKGENKQKEKEKEEAAVIPIKVAWYVDIPGVKIIDEFLINDPKGKNRPKKAWGRIGILDRGMGHRNEYGFDLIKNGRVIEEFVLDKDLNNRDIGLIASNHNARIVGQLFLDEWETDHQKTSFLKDTEQWQKLTERISKEVKYLLSVSSNLQNPGELLKQKYNLKSDEEVQKTIADKKFKTSIPKIEKGVQKAIRSGSVKSTLNDLEKRRKDKPVPSQKKEKISSPKAGMSITKLLFTTPDIAVDNMGEDAPLVKTDVKKERSTNILKITLNRDHPFLSDRESAELKVIGEFLSVDYYASYVLQNKQLLTHEDFISLRDTMLKELTYRKD